MVSRVIPPAEDEGAKVDGTIKAGEVAVSVWGRRNLSRASLRRTVAASMELNCEVRRFGKGNRKMAKDPHDSRRKNKLITGRCIPIDIYKG